MTVPLPGGMADKLIAHLGSCPQCRLAKVFPSEQKCSVGQNLLQQTMIERHGPR